MHLALQCSHRKFILDRFFSLCLYGQSKTFLIILIFLNLYCDASRYLYLRFTNIFKVLDEDFDMKRDKQVGKSAERFF
jgi:DNA replication protein DnaC